MLLQVSSTYNTTACCSSHGSMHEPGTSHAQASIDPNLGPATATTGQWTLVEATLVKCSNTSSWHPQSTAKTFAHHYAVKCHVPKHTAMQPAWHATAGTTICGTQYSECSTNNSLVTNQNVQKNTGSRREATLLPLYSIHPCPQSNSAIDSTATLPNQTSICPHSSALPSRPLQTTIGRHPPPPPQAPALLQVLLP
jgi:hypothetical protein